MNAASKNRNPFRHVLRPFVAGVLALLPIALTIMIIAWLAAIVHDFLGPGSTMGGLLKRVGWNFGTSDLGAYLGGVVFALATIYIFGILVQTSLRSLWSRWSDGLFSRVPVVSTVYDAAKKLVDMMEPQENVELQSMTPVFCRMGGEQGTGFPAFMPTSEVFMIGERAYHVVMIPTAPIPFGGAILCVPKESISPMQCGIDGLLNMYMSMGTTVPQHFANATDSGASGAQEQDPVPPKEN